MSLLTQFTRMLLTRSSRPFTFTNEVDEVLDYESVPSLGLYVHIPFCRSLCSFCPYCKVVFETNLADRYVDGLIQEIHLVGQQTKDPRPVTSLYFGGGTPALVAHRLKDIMEALQEHFFIGDGVGIELHPEDATPALLQTLKEAGVTKISLGIQSFQETSQNVLGRRFVDTRPLAQALKEVPFETVSMDFIFALPGQTLGDLQQDLSKAAELGANAFAIYPFIDFSFTKSSVKSLSKNEKRQLLEGITQYCLDRGWDRTSLWTFASHPKARYSSMTRDNYLGFGCSAVTLLPDQFKINTFSVEGYLRRIVERRLPTSLTLRFTRRQRMLYYLFWTAYTMEVSSEAFANFFGVQLEDVFGFELKMAQKLGFLTYNKGAYRLTSKGAFYFHYYENFYTLSYIDKMWGLLRKEAFPKGMTL